MGIKTRVARSTSDVVNCLPNATAQLQWPLAGEMTADSHLPSRDELEALSESGFALAIQLLGRHEDAADVVQDALRKLVHSGHYKAEKGNTTAPADHNTTENLKTRENKKPTKKPAKKPKRRTKAKPMKRRMKAMSEEQSAQSSSSGY